MAITASKQRQIDELTDAQRECLRLVLAHKTSKQISRELGLSHHTVDQRLRFAIKTLGVQNRTEAALMLAEAEHQDPQAAWTYQSPAAQIPTQPPVLTARSVPPAMDMDYDAILQKEGQSNPNTLHDVQSITSISQFQNQNPSLLSGIDLKTIRKNNMSPYTRLAFIGGLSFASILIFAIAISSLNSLSALYH